ncbi:hypothetical protein Mapa_014631 [Marchantia paleacea]|nr:hypothetical protein Mapa_014631 [Marchantia paleacea]
MSEIGFRKQVSTSSETVWGGGICKHATCTSRRAQLIGSLSADQLHALTFKVPITLYKWSGCIRCTYVVCQLYPRVLAVEFSAGSAEDLTFCMPLTSTNDDNSIFTIGLYSSKMTNAFSSYGWARPLIFFFSFRCLRSAI